ncbi:hypothetical protein X730_21450 [Mesorhizobium sp. L103C565B0]|nr:hypothetical protein X749_06680 [Mesorhizobium sp. LNJC391B00]ESZ45956.1 hypothetical protein X730_21450 [Mesorhizobium sp. L103C565B0]
MMPKSVKRFSDDMMFYLFDPAPLANHFCHATVSIPLR